MRARQRVMKIARDNDCRNIVEVGVFKGNLSDRLATLPNLEALFLVDPHSAEWTKFDWDGDDYAEDVYECCMSHPGTLTQADLDEIHQEMQDKFSNNGKVTILRLPSHEAVSHFEDGSLDMVFIDAIHLYKYVKQDIELWLPKLRKGGIIAGDDYAPRFKGVQQAVDEFGGCTVMGVVWWKQV